MHRMRWILPFALLSALVSSPASAQSLAPQGCGMTESSADYGPLEIGSTVTLQRHRFLDGDDNWDARMERWLGRAGRITRFAGVDNLGCPGVRVDVDGQAWFWRIRDLGVGTGPRPPRAERDGLASSSEVPQQCNQDDANPDYGPIVVGTEVILGRHRSVEGDDNWTTEMGPYVGQRARIMEQSGVDGMGCPGVRVDVDQRQWFWRIRDMRLSTPGGTSSPAMVISTSLAMDHGRPETAYRQDDASDTSGLFGSGGQTPPQECGRTDTTVEWGPIQLGSQVTLGRHREVSGDFNWSPEMDPFIGRQARITELVGVDDRGCAVVRIDVDNGEFYWRIRDMTVR